MQSNKENRDPRRRRRRSRIVVISSITIPPKPSMPVLDEPEPQEQIPVKAQWTPPIPKEPLPQPEEIQQALQASDTFEPSIPWRTPPRLDLTPTRSEWSHWRRLTPTPDPNLHYEYGFRIIPGEAYQDVPLFIDRTRKWELIEVEIPEKPAPKVFRTDIEDPRNRRLTIPLVDCLALPKPSPRKDPEVSYPITDEELLQWLMD